MRLAVVVAPSDLRAGDAASRRAELAWLRGQLAKQRFDIVIVSGGHDPRAAIEKAAPTINPGDTVLVHVSGRLVGQNELAFGGSSGSVPLSVIPLAFAARMPEVMAVAAELTVEDTNGVGVAPDDALAIRVTTSLSGGVFQTLAALRALGPQVPRFDFSRAAFQAPELAEPLALHEFLAALERRAVATQGSYDRTTRLVHARIAEAPGMPPPVPVAAPSPGRSAPVAVDAPREPAPAANSAAVASPPTASAVANSADVSLPAAAVQAVTPTEEPAPQIESAVIPPPPSSANEIPPPPISVEELSPIAPDVGPDVEAQIAAATTVGDWRTVAELRLDRLATLVDPKAQVRELIAVARVLQAELADPEGAIAALEQARSIEPARVSVLRALRRGYEAHGRWADAADTLEALATLADTPTQAAGYRAAQARIALDQNGDPERARFFVQDALARDPAHAESLSLHTRLDALDASRASVASSGVEYSPVASAAPGTPPQAARYAASFASYQEQGNADAAFLSAMALEELGAAGGVPSIVIEQHRAVTPVRARASLDAWAWGLLRAPEYDELVGALFASVEAAAIAAKLDELREARRLPVIDRATRLSETSTASVVRSFQWAARFLGVRCPDLYALPEAPGVAVIHAPDPSTALGRGVLSGQTAKDLAFIAGRHLTYYRPEHHVLLYYPSRDDLTLLLFAAVQLAGADSPSTPPAVRSLRGRLERRIGGRERAVLRDVVRKLDERGGQAKVGAFMRAVELTAARAALFMCGDLATATAIVRGESRAVAELSAEERREDLIAFCASPGHVALRARFVATGAESVLPPPLSVAPRTAAQ